DAVAAARKRLGQQHIVDLHAADHRLAVEPVVGNVPQRYRIEFVEADGIGAGLIFGPGDPGFGHNARGRGADTLRARMQLAFRDGCGDGEYGNSAAPTAEIGVARKGPDDNIEHEYRAVAVADKPDFVHRAFACTREQRLGRSIEARIDIRTATVNVVVGANPIVQQLLHAPAPPGPAQKDEEDGNAGG